MWRYLVLAGDVRDASQWSRDHGKFPEEVVYAASANVVATVRTTHLAVVILPSFWGRSDAAEMISAVLDKLFVIR